MRWAVNLIDKIDKNTDYYNSSLWIGFALITVAFLLVFINKEEANRR